MKPKKPAGKKACGCINHNIFYPPSTDVSLRGRSYFERRADYRELLRRLLVDRRVLNICTICLDYGKRKMAESHDRINNTSDHVNDELSTDERSTEDINCMNQKNSTDDTSLELNAVTRTADQTVTENTGETFEGFGDIIRANTECDSSENSTDNTSQELNAFSRTADQTVPENTGETVEWFGDSVSHTDFVYSGASADILSEHIGVSENARMISTKDGNPNQLLDMKDVEKEQLDMEVQHVEETLDDTVEEIKRMTARLRGLKRWYHLNNDVKDSLCELSLVLGSLINKELDNERFQMAHQCRDFPTLVSIKPQEWYKQRNPILTNFLQGCTGVSPNTTKKKKLNSAIHAIEQIMYTKNNNIVTPFALQRNIIIYMVSHSKIITSVCGSWEPSGSYTKVNEILKSPTPPLNITGKNDIVVTFDNEQKVGRHSGRIREGSLQSISIITTVAVIETKPPTQYQFLPYRRNDFDSVATITSVNSLEARFLEIMRLYRHRFVEEIIGSVFDEQFQNDTDFVIDAVDVAVMNEGKYVCSCGHMEDNTSFFQHGFDKYFRTASMHTLSPTIKNADPILVNPTGFENCTEVLSQIRIQAIDSSENRKSVVVTCDGVPYTHASEIQDEYLECLVCHKLIKKDEKKGHTENHKVNKIEYKRAFGELLLRPGAGHIELNMGRKLLNFLWIPLMSELSTHFGFRTPNAKLVFKSGVDHHRTREILECMLFSLSKELVRPYVLDAIHSKEAPSASGYVTWYEHNVINQNFSFIYHVTFSYLLSFHMFNEAVRKNNSDNMMAARTAFHPIFFVGHHPMYKKLHLRDMVERVSYPKEIGEYLKKTETFSKSGKDNRGQGADFIHEKVNREIKSFLPKAGVPSKKTWVDIIRKVDQLKEMKSALLLNSDINNTTGKKRPKKFHHEITMVRRILRQKGYLSKYNDDSFALSSLTGESLDHSLCDFNFVIKESYDQYKEEYKNNGEFGSNKPTPVFMTLEERLEYEKIESRTIKEITEKIKNLANSMPNKNESQNVLLRLKKVKRKHEFVALYKESERSLEEQNAALKAVEEATPEPDVS